MAKNKIRYNNIYSYTDRKGRLKIKIKIDSYDGESYCRKYILPIISEFVRTPLSICLLYTSVPGHPLVAERSVLNLINLCNENNIEYKILPAVSFVDAMMDRLQIDPIEGLKIIDAFDIKNQILDKRIGTIITQVYNVLIASEVKLELLEYYNDETEIYLSLIHI